MSIFVLQKLVKLQKKTWKAFFLNSFIRNAPSEISFKIISITKIDVKIKSVKSNKFLFELFSTTFESSNAKDTQFAKIIIDIIYSNH